MAARNRKKSSGHMLSADFDRDIRTIGSGRLDLPGTDFAVPNSGEGIDTN
jgi:hypothetical protein